MAENKNKETELATGEVESKKSNSESKETKPVKVKKDGVFTKLFKLLKGSKSELKKITWASKKATTKNSILVLVVLVIVGVILGVLDIGFNWLINTIINLY